MTRTLSMLRRRLALNVLRLREAHGFTQERTAGAAELNLRHLQKVEAAESNATLKTLVGLANALDVDPAELLTPLKKRRSHDR